VLSYGHDQPASSILGYLYERQPASIVTGGGQKEVVLMGPPSKTGQMKLKCTKPKLTSQAISSWLRCSSCVRAWQRDVGVKK